MEYSFPRIIISGTHSGCGKTTVCCALLQALVNRGIRPAAFKCGPDYIDPMFHSRIIGAASANLDTFFFDDDMLKSIFKKNSAGCDAAVIEGVMGFYDGLGLSGRAGTYELSERLGCPAVLTVDAKGASLSLLALIQGFLDFQPGNKIAGVIFNRCRPALYESLARETERRFHGRIRPLGYMPPMKECSLGSRNLGLITAAEVEDLREKLSRLAGQAEKSLDIDGILELAGESPPLSFRETEIKKFEEKIRIAVADDRAFCFKYSDSLGLLEEMGAELLPFSPLEDGSLPENIQGLYLCGGYPELYSEELSKNKSMLKSVREAVLNKLPCIAECGGFMYLSEAAGGREMAAAVRGSCFDTGKLSRFGYVKLTANEDNLLCRAGESIAAHEFHYWDSTDPGSAFTAEKADGRSWSCVQASGSLYAGFPHFHFCSNTNFAVRFYEACLREKHKND
jgi:cobyrinic acid a,c-diamide synthase